MYAQKDAAGTASYLLIILAAWLSSCAATAEPIERIVPPIGIQIPDTIQQQTSNKLTELRGKFKTVRNHPSAADADVLLKAVQLALSQREIYEPRKIGVLAETLSLAEQRIDALKTGGRNWQHDRLTVRGFYSRIDDSPQPYGLVIPNDLPQAQPAPLYVWLHGRGDKTTDIHFIKQRLENVGQISPPGAIVLHPFGRQCLGYKSAGETDVLEAIEHVKEDYNIDSEQIVLMGFSMGGAGAWHLGAHYTDRFVAISPGAGFAETAQYQKLSTEQIANTPWFERQLWAVYDVPHYVRNFFNTPIVCYSGENDKQIQAARVMESAFLEHGRTLDHVIGPGMGHKYHPDALAEIMAKIDAAVKQIRREPTSIRLQTQTLRYSRMHWVSVERLEHHWSDSTIDAEMTDGSIRITTKNIAQLTIDPVSSEVRRVVIDNQAVDVSASGPIVLSKTDVWRLGPLVTSWSRAKKPGLQGPIDDAFLDRFLVVTPSTESSNSRLNQWVTFELEHLRKRWNALFRADLPEKPADEITADDIRTSNLVAFGDPESNTILRRVIEDLPMEWKGGVQVTDTKHKGYQYVPAMIYPNPLNQAKYIVVNSGPTFREAHDRTNSLQNPKLPDWAIFDISTPPNADAAGNVVQAGFFDEHWKP